MHTPRVISSLLLAAMFSGALAVAAPATPASARSTCASTATRQVSVSVTRAGRTVEATVCVNHVTPVAGGGVSFSGETLDRIAADDVCTVAEFRVTARRFAPGRTNQTKMFSSATSRLPGCAGTPQFFAGMFLPESQAVNVTRIGVDYRVERTEFRACIHSKSTGAALRCSAWQRG